MKPAPDKLLDEAMKLPARARARLAARLLESLELGVPARTPEEWSAAWSVEVARRLQSI